MKLQCQVEVLNRTHHSINLKNTSKSLKSTLALGKELKRDTEYFIIHFSTANKSGTKYSVKNIKQVFVKCLNDGKSTIRFVDPPHDLLIRCESIQLKCFMRLLKSCISGDTKALQLASLTSLSVTAKDNAPTKLVIRDRGDFPSKGLPRTLESLYMSGLKLCNFRREILMLKHLCILELSNNEIEKLPTEFGRLLNLRELHLANNQLGIKEEVDWRWLLEPQISKSLKLLDLSGNKLAYLPKAMWKLQSLVCLKVDNNKLHTLPASLGRISSLRYLTLSQNKLEFLPCSLMQCRLENIDICTNNFHQSESDIHISDHNHWDIYVGNLVNLASKVVLKQKIYYAPSIIPRTLVQYLDNTNMCICGSPATSDMTTYYKQFDLKDFFNVVVFDNNRNSYVVFECFFCSSRCYKKMHGVSRR